jgi:hypothetical protein
VFAADSRRGRSPAGGMGVIRCRGLRRQPVAMWDLAPDIQIEPPGLALNATAWSMPADSARCAAAPSSGCP